MASYYFTDVRIRSQFIMKIRRKIEYNIGGIAGFWILTEDSGMRGYLFGEIGQSDRR